MIVSTRPKQARAFQKAVGDRPWHSELKKHSCPKARLEFQPASDPLLCLILPSRQCQDDGVSGGMEVELGLVFLMLVQEDRARGDDRGEAERDGDDDLEPALPGGGGRIR